MRRIFFFAMMLVTSLVTVAQDNTEAANVSTGEPFMAFLADEGQGTNILNKARGATVMTLSSDFDYIFYLTAPQDGWWKVLEIWRVGDDDSEVVLEGSDTGEYWIHHSALGLGTRNYGSQELCLRVVPDEGGEFQVARLEGGREQQGRQQSESSFAHGIRLCFVCTNLRIPHYNCYLCVR